MFLLLSLFALTSASIADSGSLTESQLARSRFKFAGSGVVRTHVQTCNSKGKVTEIQLRVTEGALNMSSLQLFYMSGAEERLAGLKLRKGEASSWLALGNQTDPCLKKIQLNISSGGGPTFTTVEIFGQWKN